jgi:hypothetical protein
MLIYIDSSIRNLCYDQVTRTSLFAMGLTLAELVLLEQCNSKRISVSMRTPERLDLRYSSTATAVLYMCNLCPRAAHCGTQEDV